MASDEIDHLCLRIVVTCFCAPSSVHTTLCRRDLLRLNAPTSGIISVIPPKSNRKFPPDFGKHSYKWRLLIENYFQKLKEFKRIALRACKTGQSFSSMIYLAAAIINSR